MICGQGYNSRGKWLTEKEGKQTKEYRTWCSMIYRCYDNKSPTYKNCIVSEDWKDFQVFAEDIQYLKGYLEWKNSNKKREYALDKDIRVKGNKMYSKDTCIFVTQSENLKNRVYTGKFKIESVLTGKKYLAVRLEDGYMENFYNQSKFARKYNLKRGAISKCLNGKQKYYKGWMFIIEN